MISEGRSDGRSGPLGIGVDDDHLVGRRIAGKHALERLAQRLRAGKRRDDDGEAHLLGHDGAGR